MEQREIKRQIVRKLQELINSEKGLWVEIGELARTLDYILAVEDFQKRVLMELDVIEKTLGKTEKTEDIRLLIASLSRSIDQQAPIPSAA